MKTSMTTIGTLIGALLFLFLHTGCTISSDISGTGSQAGNGKVVGTILQSDGTPASEAKVFIRSPHSLKDTTDLSTSPAPDAITNADGSFTIDSVSPGSYYIEIKCGTTDAGLLECVKDSLLVEPTNIGTIQLTPQTRFYGTVSRDNISTETNIFVQLYGLDRAQKANTNGEFSFANLPAGTFNVRIFSSNASLGAVDSEAVTLDPDEEIDAGTFILPFEYWRDTLVVRQILDTNGHNNVPVSQVTTTEDGRIKELNLSNMAISLLPPCIGNLRITHLIISDNNLTLLPMSIARVASLRYLNCANNQLSSLPKSIGNCKRLFHLELSENHFSENFPMEIGRLTSLRYLGFQRNKVRRIAPPIGKLVKLEVLDLGHNHIGKLPFEITKLKNLTYLSVNNNKLFKIPPEIARWIDTYSFDKQWRKTQRRRP